MIIEMYPLSWPIGYKRTHTKKSSLFKKHTIYQAREDVEKEIRRMGGTNLIISSNLRTRKDGGVHSKQKEPGDSGVAVWFMYKGKQTVLPCDTYYRVWENTYAIAKGLYALRSLNRWGISGLQERALTGCIAITDHAGKPLISETWFDVLGVEPGIEISQLKKRYRELIKEYHPDLSDSNSDEFFRFKSAYDEGLKSFDVNSKGGD